MNDDQERLRQEEHWRELAELLGIEPTPPGTELAQTAELKNVVFKPEEAKPSHPKEPITREPSPEPATVPASTEAYAEDLEPVEPQGEESPSPEGAPEAHTERDWRETEEKTRKGRRRKGRGNKDERRSRRTNEEPSEFSDKDSFPAQGEPDETTFPDASGHLDEEIEEATEPVEAQTEEDLDEEDTLRDWNVPSWNELIASLYRPDR